MKKTFKTTVSLTLVLVLCLSLFACGSTFEEFQCDLCGMNITEGGKNKITYPYDDKEYFACDDCAVEMEDMKDGILDETHNRTEIIEVETTTETTGFIQSSLIPESAKLIAYGYDENNNLYELVGEQIDMYAGIVNKLGVIKNDEWLIPMTDDTPFHDTEGNYIDGVPLLGAINVNGLYFKDTHSTWNASNVVRYIGNGCFYMRGYHRFNTYARIWNSETNDFFVVNNGDDWDDNNYDLKIDLPDSEFEMYNNDGRFLLSHYLGAQGYEYFLLDTDTMNIQSLPFTSNGADTFGGEVVGPYSEGKIALIKQRGVADSANGFYDTNGNKVIDLSNYLITDYAVAFIDGQATFTTQDYDGTYYLTTLDSNGNEINKVEK